MKIGRSYIEDPLYRVRRTTTGLLDQKRDRVRLINQPKPAAAVTTPLIARIEKYATANQNAVRIRNKRRDPPHVVVPAQWSLGALHAIVDVGANGFIPMAIVGRVDRIFGRVFGNRESRNRQLEHARATIKRKDMRTVAESENEGSLRSVNDEARGELLVARAKKMAGRL